MEPGIWISVGNIATNSQVYKEHTKWAVIGRDGEPDLLHSPHDIYAITGRHGTTTYSGERL